MLTPLMEPEGLGQALGPQDIWMALPLLQKRRVLTQTQFQIPNAPPNIVKIDLDALCVLFTCEIYF